MARRAYVLSLTHIPTDGRVLRQIAALVHAGFDVTAIGLSGASGTKTLLPDAVAMATMTGCNAPMAGPAPSYVAIDAAQWSSRALLPALPWLVVARLAPRLRSTAADQLPGIALLKQRLQDLLNSMPGGPPPLVIANDWQALPALSAAVRRHGVIGHYDSHELAAEEHADRFAWRLLFPPTIRSIEAQGLAACRSVSCVSPGIANALQERYQLAILPAVVRNVPVGQPVPPRQPGTPIKVLFHGLLKSGRGLEDLIKGTAHWPDGFNLVIRGRATNAAYAKTLERRIAMAPPGRITLEPMVPQADVVATASMADVGVLPYDTSLAENRFALPNKLFEYLHAGIVPVVPADSDAAQLLADYGVGFAIDFTDPSNLGAQLGRIDPVSIWQQKRKVHAAAGEMNWGLEMRRLLDVLPEP